MVVYPHQVAARGSCRESCEIVYCRMFACVVSLRGPFLGHRWAETLVLVLLSSPLIACINLCRVLWSSRTHSARPLRSLMSAVMTTPPRSLYTSMAFSSVAASTSSIGDSTELVPPVVLWESEVGLTLFRFLFVLVILSILEVGGWGYRSLPSRSPVKTPPAVWR